MDKVELDWEKLQNGPREWLHRARNWSKADAWRAPWPPESGQFVVVKDMRKRPLWFRLLAGRYFLSREIRALQALEDMKGVPNFVARPHPDCLVIQWLPGTPALDFKKGEIPSAALENLTRLVQEVHAHGVAHGDLHRDNVLVDGDNVSLIDWATASVFKNAKKRKWSQVELQALDSRAVAKIKLRHAPFTLSDREREMLTGGSPLYGAVRNLGYKFRRLRGANAKHSPAEMAKRYSSQLEKAAAKSSSEKSQ